MKSQNNTPFSFNSFRFLGYDISDDLLKVTFRYGFDKQQAFNEVLVFPEPIKLSQALDQALKLYWLLAGVSYYKVCPWADLVIENDSIDEYQAEFLNTVYSNGLGEYIYKNQLDPGDISSFKPNTDSNPPIATEPKGGHGALDGALLLLGGGKDSLVAAELLKRTNKVFNILRVNSNEWIDQQITLIGSPAVVVQRQIDGKITTLNSQGALNGHIPITALISAIALISALSYGFRDIILSNEASTEQENITYKGMKINHQFAKTFEFEKLFSDYTNRYISKKLRYFSLLRDRGELKIAQLFAKHCFAKYSGNWSSSNHNFKQGATGISWEPDSPKSMSVFGLLAPFVPREALIDEFGANLFESGPMEVWDQLLGNTGVKPFECVATTQEMNQALMLAKTTGNWPELEKFKIQPLVQDETNETSPDRIPDDYRDSLAD